MTQSTGYRVKRLTIRGWRDPLGYYAFHTPEGARSYVRALRRLYPIGIFRIRPIRHP